MKTILALAIFLTTTEFHAKEPPPAQALASIDSVIEQELKTFQVPGVAVAVVVGDEVVLSKGYGLRDVEKKLPMAAETQMPIASVTKQFTVAALGTLVRQGKLDWDKPVREYLPDFRMHNEYATSHITPRDLVTHRSGLPRHDAIWYGTDLSSGADLSSAALLRVQPRSAGAVSIQQPDVHDRWISRRADRQEQLGRAGEERALRHRSG